MRPADLPEIRALPLFRAMSETNFEALMSHAYAQVFPEGLELIREGDPADFLHVLVEGRVELYAEWRDSQCTMGIVDPVGAFIIAACITDAPYLMSARTSERSRIVLVPAPDLKEMFLRDSAFAVSVINELALSYRTMVRHAKSLKLRNSRERIAAYLLQQSRLAGDRPTFLLPVEKRHLASYLGMTPENLSRALKSLEADGVKIDGGRVIVTDRAGLTALACPDPLLDGPDPEAGFAGPATPAQSQSGRATQPV